MTVNVQALAQELKELLKDKKITRVELFSTIEDDSKSNIIENVEFTTCELIGDETPFIILKGENHGQSQIIPYCEWYHLSERRGMGVASSWFLMALHTEEK